MLETFSEYFINLTTELFVAEAYQSQIIGIASLLTQLANDDYDDTLDDIKKDTQAIREGSFNAGIDYLNAIKNTSINEETINSYLRESERSFRQALGVYKNVLYYHPLIEFYIGFSILCQGRKDGYFYLKNSLEHTLDHVKHAMFVTSIAFNNMNGEVTSSKKSRNFQRVGQGTASGITLLTMLATWSAPPMALAMMASFAGNYALAEYDYREKIKELDKILSPLGSSLIKKLSIFAELAEYNQEISRIWQNSYYVNAQKWYESVHQEPIMMEGYWTLEGFESGKISNEYKEQFKVFQDTVEINLS